MIKVGINTVVLVRSVGGSPVWFPARAIILYPNVIFWNAGEQRWWSTEYQTWLEERAFRWNITNG